MSNVKQNKLAVVLSLAISLGGLGACTPKQRQRQPHEGPKDWSVRVDQRADDVATIQGGSRPGDLARLDLEAMAKKVNAADVEKSVLEPLARFVLDPIFMSLAANRHARSERALSIFNEALLFHLSRATVESQTAWLSRYERALFYGCEAGLRRGCANVEPFAVDSRTARILLKLATLEDSRLEAEIKTHGSPRTCAEKSTTCRNLTHLRYRRLAMAFSIKRTETEDQELAFAFMKYIRVLERVVELGQDVGYLNETYRSIFEILISRYKPRDVNDPSFREFIENFNPWGYSNKRAEVFRLGSKAMFDLATRCCLYTDQAQSKISNSIRQAIASSQSESDAGLPSFHMMVQDLEARGRDRSADVLSNLGLKSDLARIRDLKSDFYSEYFFVLDRLFREHIDSGEAMRILERTNPHRARTELLATLKTYMRVHLAFMTVQTIDFMSGIYNSKQVSSNAIFAEAIMVSADISKLWMRVQSRLDILDKFVGSYFSRSATTVAEHKSTTDLMKSVNRNVHYLSVYPNMIGMTYFLAKNQAPIRAKSWWGAEFEIKPATVVEELFEGGIQTPWFKFASDAVLLSRERLFFAFHYALKTQALETFTVEEKDSAQSDRAKFFELTLGKYLDADRRSLDDLNQLVEREIIGAPGAAFTTLERMCRYELVPGSPPPPTLSLGLLELSNMTYSGLGQSGHFGLIHKLFVGDVAEGIENLYKRLEPKLLFVRTVIRLLEDHMLSVGEIKSRNEAQSELANIRRIVEEVEARRKRLLSYYFRFHKPMFACAKRLYQIEMMRANRLIDEERQHLGRVHDLLKIVQQTPVAQREKKLQELNNLHFKGKSRFDRLNSDSYHMTKFDFLMRTKDRLERDIFVEPTARERALYGADLKALIKRRPVRVEMPAGLERLDIYVNDTPPYPVTYTADKEDFVREGLKYFNGKVDAYADWLKAADQLNVFKSYLETLVNLYLMGPVEVEVGGRSEMGEVTGEELLRAFADVVELAHLNDAEVENAVIMGLDGRFSVGQLEGFVLEPVTRKAQPVLRWLMSEVYSRAGFSVGSYGLVQSGKTLADILSSEGVIIFEPGEQFRRTLTDSYGAPIRRILGRATKLFRQLPALEKDPEWQKLFRVRLRVEDGRALDLAASKGRDALEIVDHRILNNLRIEREDFTRRTDDRFGTKALVEDAR